MIAKEAGISQPYLFRLFRTKRELFLACNDRACEKVLDAFRRAAAAAPEGERLHAMGHAYVTELLPDRHAILMLMQGYAAVADPEIQEHVRSATARSSARWPRSQAPDPRRCGASSPPACCSTSSPRSTSSTRDHPVFKAWTALHA